MCFTTGIAIKLVLEEKMREMICRSCGSNHFHKEGNQIICDYCKGVYSEDEKPPQQVVREPLSEKKGRSGTFFWIAAVILIIVVPGLMTAGGDDFSTAMNRLVGKESVEKPPVTINDIGGWTEEIYNNIVVATKEHNSETEKYSYSGGGSYDELVKTVGNPSSSYTSYEDENDEFYYGQPDSTRSTWNRDVNCKSIDGQIIITFELESRMIIDKEFYSD
jgi:transcription initiation factor TFIIIB Brf1 subunit/transcription initiation factor TFIIB